MLFEELRQVIFGNQGVQASSNNLVSSNNTRQAFRLGELTTSNSSFPVGHTADSALHQTGGLMTRRIRDEYRNNTQTKRSTELLRDLIVGCGMQTFADPIDWTFGFDLSIRPERMKRSLNYSFECDQKFERWASNKDLFDIAGKVNFWEAQRLAISENVQVGTTLFLRCRGRGKNFPLCFQIVEYDQIDKDRSIPENGGVRVVNGFELDAQDRELGCYIYDVHPDSYGYIDASYQSTFVPADRYLHLFKKYRPAQNSGTTWLHSTGDTLRQRKTLSDAVLRRIVKQSLLTMVLKTENPGQNAFGMGETDSLGRPGVKFGDDPRAAEIGSKDDLQLIESESSNEGVINWLNAIDDDHARGINVSNYSYHGRFERANYGGFKGALNLENHQMRPLQEWFGDHLVLPIRSMWNALAVGTGQIENVTAVEYRDEPRFSHFDCIGAGRFFLDPGREVDAAAGMVRAGFSTLKIECGKLGLHWLRVIRQIAVENQVTGLVGVNLDHTKSGQALSNSRSAEVTEIQQFIEHRFGDLVQEIVGAISHHG